MIKREREKGEEEGKKKEQMRDVTIEYTQVCYFTFYATNPNGTIFI